MYCCDYAILYMVPFGTIHKKLIIKKKLRRYYIGVRIRTIKKHNLFYYFILDISIVFSYSMKYIVVYIRCIFYIIYEYTICT